MTMCARLQTVLGILFLVVTSNQVAAEIDAAEFDDELNGTTG